MSIDLRWRQRLMTIIRENNSLTAQKNKKSGNGTQRQRREVIVASFKAIRSSGYNITEPRRLKEKHVQALVDGWVEKGLAAKTMSNNLSIMRVFSSWIGKQSLVQPLGKYLPEGMSDKLRTGADVDKSWTAKTAEASTSPLDLLYKVYEKDEVIGIQLELQAAFGLRAREAWLIRPFESDQDNVLLVNRGTKGSRDRIVCVDSDYKRDVLNRAKLISVKINGRQGFSMIPKHRTIPSWATHFYRICRDCGISRKSGIVTHGLRHQYANDKFEKILGVPSPVRGGTMEDVDQELYLLARLDVSEDLGHSRARIAGAYCGDTKTIRKNKKKIGLAPVVASYQELIDEEFNIKREVKEPFD